MSDGSYFVDHKRGEVMELRSHLRNDKIARDPKQIREVIKKVIAYMTLGIDVSTLFSDMVMATNTRDLVQKKMVYLYLCTYAASKPDLTLLAVNTLQRDCRDDDPMVRGLALRSLCSLRVNNLVEYVMDPIRNGLQDGSAYVRKTAVMGVAKLFTISPPMVRNSDFIDVLYNMIKDKDPLVVINSINSLNEILIDEGGMAINRSIIHHLLNRLQSFNEWSQITVLDLVARYKPQGGTKAKTEQEIFDIMNLLEDRLRHSNSALVLATTKVFLNLTKDLENVNREVYKRIKTPMLTLISNPNHAIAFPVIAHAALLARKRPDVWADSYKQFFCRYNDPLCVKELKVEILSDIALSSNAFDIMNELAEYITDIHVEIARLSIQSIGKIAIRVKSAFEEAMRLTISFLDMNQDYIVAESCVSIKNMLRKYPNEFEMVLPRLKSIMKSVEETEGKCAVLWLIGEYGEHFIEAPYILETFIDSYEDEESSGVKLELLTSCMKLFFKRSPEMQNMLGRLFNKSIKDSFKIDVRDRAAFYYRLLQNTPLKKAQEIINCPQIIIDTFDNESNNNNNNDISTIDQIFEEYNTLAVIYKKPSIMFINDEPTNMGDDDDDDEEDEDNEKNNKKNENEEDEEDEDDDNDDIEDNKKNKKTKIKMKKQEKKEEMIISNENNNDDIMGIDLLGLNDGNNELKINLKLNPNAQCNSKTFQNLWKQLPISKTMNKKLSQNNPENVKKISILANNAHFKLMAKGSPKGAMKCYFYTQIMDSNKLYFVECIVTLANLNTKITFKGEDKQIEKIAILFENTMQSIME